MKKLPFAFIPLLFVSGLCVAKPVMTEEEAFTRPHTPAMQQIKTQCEQAFLSQLPDPQDAGFTAWRYWGDDNRGWLGAQLTIHGVEKGRLAVCPTKKDGKAYRLDDAFPPFIFY